MALLQQALREALDASIPKTSSPLAVASRRAAEDLLRWVTLESNAAISERFTTSVIELLDKAFQRTAAVNSQAAREKMWAKYHSVRNSEEFVSLWTAILQESGVCAIPICYQTVTDKLFEKRIQFHCPVATPSVLESEEDVTLTYEEENAIRYAAGYVLRSVRKKVMKSQHANKENIVETIDSLAQNCDVDDDDVSSEWVTLVDRGGLIHISDDLYRVFVAIELEVRKFFRVDKAQAQAMGSSDGQIVHRVLSNEDVLFFWCMVCSNISEEVAGVMLKHIAELWVTIRGFSFAKSYMEIYKQQNKKHLQRSKALRKKLLSGSTSV